jgi:hypothetical protein
MDIECCRRYNGALIAQRAGDKMVYGVFCGQHIFAPARMAFAAFYCLWGIAI